MDPAQHRFALASRRLYRWAGVVHALPLPERIKVAAARILGRALSPYRADLPKAMAGLQLGLKRSEADARVLCRAWLASHGLFALSIFDYRHCDADWVRGRVSVDRPEVLAQIVRRGALVLTYHSFHHNTLGIVLGQSGSAVYGVAATEQDNPMTPIIGRYLRIINGDSEARFGGGRYLYTDQPRELIRGVRDALEGGHSVVTLCDNPTPPGPVPPATVMGRQVSVGTGVLAQAQAAGAPVCFALLYPDLRGGYRLALEDAGAIEDLHATVQAYFRFLERQLEIAPWAWQGWAWWGDL